MTTWTPGFPTHLFSKHLSAPSGSPPDTGHMNAILANVTMLTSHKAELTHIYLPPEVFPDQSSLSLWYHSLCLYPEHPMFCAVPLHSLWGTVKDCPVSGYSYLPQHTSSLGEQSSHHMLLWHLLETRAE